MSKYTFIREDEDGEINSMQFEEVVWYNVLDRFVNFLRGCGFYVNSNSIGINEAAGHVFLHDYEDFNNITFFYQPKE